MDELFAISVDTGFPDSLVTVRLSGEIDTVAIPSLRAALVEAWSVHPRALVVDLSEVSFLSISAAGPLLKACSIGRRDGMRVSLLAHSRPVRKLLDLAGLSGASESV